MKTVKTIQDVITNLDEIIQQSIENQSPNGYFASTYKSMTIAVMNGIQKKVFENNQRMELLDIAFANRYFEAYEAYQKKQNCTKSWKAAFEAAKNPDLLIMQHIFLGINAHINLDLGISAAGIVARGKINSLKNDFNKINDVIASINQKVQDALNSICYPVALVDQISNGKDNVVLDFAISKARETSWVTATAANNLPNFLKEIFINNVVDYSASKVAQQIASSKMASSKILKELKKHESGDVKKNIEILASIKI